MAHKKGGGSSRNGRDSNAKRLGVKVFAGETVTGGEIIVRPRGTKFKPGNGAGIGRDDTEGRLGQFARNHRFFDAPVGVFCFVDRRMGPPQWSDLGMFLQTFMLLATERGLATCPQEAWAMWSQAVAEFVEAPDEEMLFCGVALGYADPDAPVNHLVSERMPLDEWARFL